MNSYTSNIEELTKQNSHFRQVLFTTNNLQLVLMSLPPKEEIGLETHNDNDQFFRVESGEGKAIVEDTEYILTDGVTVIVPKGVKHNIINTSEDKDLKLYTIYTPPHHKDKTVHKTKEEALSSDEEFDGVTSL